MGVSHKNSKLNPSYFYETALFAAIPHSIAFSNVCCGIFTAIAHAKYSRFLHYFFQTFKVSKTLKVYFTPNLEITIFANSKFLFFNIALLRSAVLTVYIFLHILCSYGIFFICENLRNLCETNLPNSEITIFSLILNLYFFFRRNLSAGLL